MSLHLCLDCAVIWHCYDGAPLICPRCEQPLELDPQPESVTTFSELCGWACHGQPPRRRRRWEVE